MNTMPCIRGLNCFKKGCPERAWNGHDGCPAFMEVDMKTKGGEDIIKIRECVDIYMSRLMFYNNCLLEGNQQAIESFRNGMVETDKNGNANPKSSQGELAVAYVITNAMQMKKEEIENQKTIQLDGDIKDA